VLQLGAASYNISESNATVTITVNRSGGTAGGESVELETIDGTAVAGSDYVNVVTNLAFAAGQVTRTVKISILNDTLDETNETFRVALSDPAGGGVLGAISNAVVTIVDNDSGGAISFSAASYSVNETGAVATIRVVRTGGKASGVTVDYATSDGTATAGADYTAASGQLSFGANETNKTFTVAMADDVLGEGNETVNLILSNATGGAVLGTRSTAVLTIVDNEQVLQFSRSAYTNTTESGASTIAVVRTGPTAGTVSVQYVTSNGTATAGADYTNRVGTLTFLAGQTNKTFTVPVIADSKDETNETVNLILSNAVGALLGPRSEAALWILDNDTGGAISFTAASYSVSEAGTNALVKLKRTGGKASGVTVTLTTSNGLAAAGADYAALVTNLAFNANVTNLTVRVPVINDTLDETNETFFVSLSSPTGGATLGAITNAVVTIVDNDTAGTIAFSPASYSVSETGAVATIRVVRTGGKASGVTVDYATSDGTATAGADYTAASGQLSFGLNETNKTFTVSVVNDAVFEGTETVGLKLHNPGGGAVLGTSNAVLTITESLPPSNGVTEARTLWEAGDLAGAHAAFVGVLALDPNNKDANLGAALTSLALLLNDAEVAQMILDFNQTPPTSDDLFDLISGAKRLSDFFGNPPLSPLPAVSSVQSVITNTVLPSLDAAIGQLQKVQGKNFTFELTPAMIGSTNATGAIVMDDGEFYAIGAGLNALKMLLNVLCAYRLDFDDTIVDADPLSMLHGPDGVPSAISSNFFTLKPDGASRMLTALNAFGTALTNSRAAYTFIRSNDVDAATDGGIYWEADADDSEEYATMKKLEYGFVRRLTITQQVDEVNVRINPSRFFTAPLNRTDMPTLGYDLPRDPVLSELLDRPVHMRIPNEDTDGDGNPVGDEDDEFVECSIAARSAAPDGTLNGILPDSLFNMPGIPRNGLQPLLTAFVCTNVAGVFAMDRAPSGANLIVAPAFQWDAEITTISTNGTRLSSIVTPLAITDLAAHGGSIWACGENYFWNGSDWEYQYGLFRLNADGTIAYYEPLPGDPYSTWVSAMTSDGAVLWGAVERWDWDRYEEAYEIHSYNPVTHVFSSSPIFSTTNPTYQHRSFYMRRIEGMAFDGTNLILVCGNTVLRITRQGTIVSEKMANPQPGAGLAYLNGLLYGGHDRRIRVYKP
jgi:hypothetical protein